MTRAGPALKFLLAARQSELHDLEQLARTCAFVTRVSELIHALQKERGYSNLYLCLRRDTQAAPLAALSAHAQGCEREVRAFLDALLGESDMGTAPGIRPDASKDGTAPGIRPDAPKDGTAPGIRPDAPKAGAAPAGSGAAMATPMRDSAAGKARLFDRIAYALYRLDALPELRARVQQQRVTAAEASAGFTRLIGTLLAVVFEAADAAVDPDITHLLVALLNLVQGKELAGQERAHGVTGFTAGFFNAAGKTQLTDLVAGQQRSFGTFERHAPAEILAVWQAARQHDAPVAQLRAMAGRTDPAQPVDPGMAELWFDLCTARIDAMQPIATRLTEVLEARCRQRIADTRDALRDQRLLLERLTQPLADGTPAMVFNVQGRALEQSPADGVGTELERSLLDMVQVQTDRMQRADEALALARAALDEQKEIQRAKRILMQALHLSEPDAHARLQRMAMERGQSLGALAKHVIEQGKR